MEKILSEARLHMTRRHFFGRSASGICIGALAHLLGQDLAAQNGGSAPAAKAVGGLPGLPHFAAKAKRVIYLFQSGGPSHLDLFVYKPTLAKVSGTDLPESVRGGQRLTTMTSMQASFPVVPSSFKFAQHGQSGAWLSDLLPHTARAADDICFIKSLYTDQ